MHILLTDVVTCPRCGPGFGLIVLADRLEGRQVLEGSLGCANCREEYPIHGGIADLRMSVAGSMVDPAPRTPQADPERAYRLAALLGVTGSVGPVVVVSEDPGLVEEVQRHLPEAGVLGVSRRPPQAGADVGMGWLLSDGPLPFRRRSLGGVALAAGDPLPALDEALQALSRGARVVVDPAPAGTAAVLLREGAELLLEEGGVAVASDPRAG